MKAVIIIGNVLSALMELFFAAAALVAAAFWDDPNAPAYPETAVFVGLSLFLVFIIVSIVLSHRRHSWRWAYAPVAFVFIVMAIGGLLERLSRLTVGTRFSASNMVE